MRHCTAVLLAAALVIPASASSQAVSDATVVDSDVHRVVLENEYVRVFDARASRGTKSPLHSHPPMVLISLDRTRFRLARPDGKASIVDLNPGGVAWVNGTEHSWELLAGELHAIGVEIKSAQKGGAAPPPPERKSNDAVAADPEAHHVLFENPHVRVFEGRTSRGRTSPMHSHPPTLLVSLDWFRLKLVTADGKSVVHDFSPGQLLWAGEGGEHSWEALAGDGRAIAIEVKAARPPVPVSR